MSKWISVKKELPEVETKVLLYGRNGCCELLIIGYRIYDDNSTWYAYENERYDFDEISHWASIPKLPKTKE